MQIIERRGPIHLVRLLGELTKENKPRMLLTPGHTVLDQRTSILLDSNFGIFALADQIHLRRYTIDKVEYYPDYFRAAAYEAEELHVWGVPENSKAVKYLQTRLKAHRGSNLMLKTVFYEAMEGGSIRKVVEILLAWLIPVAVLWAYGEILGRGGCKWRRH